MPLTPRSPAPLGRDVRVAPSPALATPREIYVPGAVPGAAVSPIMPWREMVPQTSAPLSLSRNGTPEPRRFHATRQHALLAQAAKPAIPVAKVMHGQTPPASATTLTLEEEPTDLGSGSGGGRHRPVRLRVP